MTKKEYKKARDCLADFKFTRGLVWLRLFLTLLAFICSLITTVLFELEDVFGVDTALLEESVLVNIILSATLLLLAEEPFALFSLKYYGAYSSIGWYEAFESDGVYAAVRISAFIVGFILLIFLFKALKKTKKSASAFIWFILLCVVDQLLAMNYYGFPSLNDYAFVVYMTYLINSVTAIMCCRAIYCADYLHKRFNKGVELKLRELKRIYKRNKT